MYQSSLLTKLTIRRGIIGLLFLVFMEGCTSSSKPPVQQPKTVSSSALSAKARQEQQQAILHIRDRILRELYQIKPRAKVEIEEAAGYGAFEVNGLNAVLEEAHGRGVVVEKATGQVTYMKMMRTDLPPAATISPYRQVLIFRNPQKLRLFLASASATLTEDPDVRIYCLNGKGFSTQAGRGTRYFLDPDLNVR